MDTNQAKSNNRHRSLSQLRGLRRATLRELVNNFDKDVPVNNRLQEREIRQGQHQARQGNQLAKRRGYVLVGFPRKVKGFQALTNKGHFGSGRVNVCKAS